MEDELDQYLEVFVTGVERGEAPVSTRTSESDLNVPFPVLPGHLGQYTAAPRAAVPTTTVRQASAYTAAAPRYASMTTTVPTTTVRRSSAAYSAPRYAPMMLPATKAAGGSSPLPSPVMSASLPPSPEASSAPAYTPNYVAPSLTPKTTTTTGGDTTGGGGAATCPPCPSCAPCPPCERASGMGGASILAILAIAGAGWYLSRR